MLLFCRSATKSIFFIAVATEKKSVQKQEERMADEMTSFTSVSCCVCVNFERDVVMLSMGAVVHGNFFFWEGVVVLIWWFICGVMVNFDHGME
jgi:ABC-type uncharacterized transport system fused permease/ATPase subunit